jgi:hypothetical protein
MGTYSGVYHPEKLIINKKDAAHSYARGHCAVGTEIPDVALNRVCKLTDGCGGPGLEGFLVYQPAGSDTGSGLSADILERISVDCSCEPKPDLVTYRFPSLRWRPQRGSQRAPDYHRALPRIHFMPSRASLFLAWRRPCMSRCRWLRSPARCSCRLALITI